jgi:hypothetical protein
MRQQAAGYTKEDIIKKSAQVRTQIPASMLGLRQGTNQERDKRTSPIMMATFSTKLFPLPQMIYSQVVIPPVCS